MGDFVLTQWSMPMNKGIGESAMCPQPVFLNLPLISARTFRSCSFTFWAFFSASWQMVGVLKVTIAILKKRELQGTYGTLLNKLIKEARNYSSYELALFYEVSKVYSMVHPPALSLLLYIALLPIGVLIGPVGTWRPDWPRVSTCVHEKRSIARVQGQAATRTQCPLLSFFPSA